MLLRGIALLVVHHVYQEANSAVDWVASFIIQYY